MTITSAATILLTKHVKYKGNIEFHIFYGAEFPYVDATW